MDLPTNSQPTMDLSKNVLTSVLVVAFALLGGGFQSVAPQVANAQTEDLTQITSPNSGAEVSGTTTLKAEYSGTTTPNRNGNLVSFAVRSGQCGSTDSTVFGNVDGQDDPYTYSTSTGEFSAEFDSTTEADGDYCFVFNPSDEGDTAEEEVNFTVANEIEDDTSEVDLNVSKTVDGGDATSSDFTFEVLDENNDPIQFSSDGETNSEFHGSADGTDLSFSATSSATTTYSVNEVSDVSDYTPTFAGDCTSVGSIAVNPANDTNYNCDIVNELEGTTTASASIQQPEVGEVTSGTTTLEATYDDGDDENEGISFAVKSGMCEMNQNPDEGGEVVFGNVSGQNSQFDFNGEDFSAEFDTTTTEDDNYCFIFNPEEDDEVEGDVRVTRDFEVSNEDEDPGDGFLEQCSAVSVESFNQAQNKNGNDVLSARSDSSEALGAEDMEDHGENENRPPYDNPEEVDYVTLGFGGSITLEFDGNVPVQEGDDLRIYETSYPEDPNDPTESQYPETAEVAVSSDGDDFESVGSVTLDGTVDIGDRQDIQYVRITDTSDPSDFGNGEHVDGFDLAGVEAIHCDDGEEPSPEMGTVQICKTAIDEDGNLIEGGADTQFDFSLTNGSSAQVSFNTPLNYTEGVDIYTNEGNDAACATFDRSVGSYEYNAENVSGTTTEADWNATYDDDYQVGSESAVNVGQAYSTTTAEADGELEVTADSTTTLAVVNQEVETEISRCEAGDILHFAAGPSVVENDGNLYRVDASTGSSTLVESYDQSQFHSSLATDEGGNLFAIREDNNNLVTLENDESIDTIGATSELIRPVAMTLGEDDNLYVLDQNQDGLYEVDMTTGSTTEIDLFADDELDVQGGDLEVADDGDLVYVRSEGDVYHIDTSNGYAVNEVGSLSQTAHISSVAKVGDTYYALDRTTEAAETADDDYYTFTLDETDDTFSSTQQEGDSGPFYYGDAARCITDTNGNGDDGDDDGEGGDSETAAFGAGGVLAGADGDNDDDNGVGGIGDVEGDQDDADTEDDEADEEEGVDLQAMLDNARNQLNQLVSSLGDDQFGVGGGEVQGAQTDSPNLPNTGDGTSPAEGNGNELGWGFFGAFAGILGLSGIVYQTTNRRKRELFE